ncbi:pectin lyase-like protein [Corynespora cassiicola Philippines]|uniref:Pectin lyase-like protein n=1 Tax=Corynespora cassiicola Philippines TaxID=1448308 RepID=A0A2T2N8Z8_CORCC|nr:pectin lyase-like protein [Corynespora cassiicola Philippines]
MKFTVAALALTAGSAIAKPINVKRAAAVDELVGYGAGTTGGGSGAGTTVTSCAELSAAAEAGGVIKVDGVLDGCGIIRLVADTSILGVGSASGLKSGGFQIRKVSNIIIRNMIFDVAPEGKDIIDIEESTQIWVDHNEFHSVGITGDKDAYDGLLDAKRGSDNLTFSWNKFKDHWKGSLMGHSDSAASSDTGKLKVTYHHNLFENVNSRLPSIRFGTAHIYSSCYVNGPTSGINSRMGAQVLVEENSFTDVQLAVVTDLDSKEDGFATERNNIFTNSDTRITQEASLTIPYEYTTDPAASACDIVNQSAGAGVVTF